MKDECLVMNGDRLVTDVRRLCSHNVAIISVFYFLVSVFGTLIAIVSRGVQRMLIYFPYLPPPILIEILPEFTRNLSSCIPKRGLIYSLSRDIHMRNGSNIFIKNTTIIRQGNRSNRFHIMHCYSSLESWPI